MVTEEEAEHGSYFHVTGHCNVKIGARGRVILDYVLYRQNGSFKRHANGKWRRPLKRGLYEYAEITEDNVNLWHTEANCEARIEAEYLRKLPTHELVGLNRTGYAGVGN